jgi:hypothetical protein
VLVVDKDVDGDPWPVEVQRAVGESGLRREMPAGLPVGSLLRLQTAPEGCSRRFFLDEFQEAIADASWAVTTLPPLLPG